MQPNTLFKAIVSIKYQIYLYFIFLIGEAVCSGLPAGDVSITLHTGFCSGKTFMGEGETGWPSTNGNGPTRFIIEEIHLNAKYSAGTYIISTCIKRAKRSNNDESPCHSVYCNLD